MLDILLGPRRKMAHGDAGGWWPLSGLFGGRLTRAGVTVSEDQALTYSAVWRATQVIACTGGMLPLVLYRKLANGGREEATGHPAYRLAKSAPNPEMASMPVRTGRLMHMVNWGNAFQEIERDRAERPVALWPIHPSRVRRTRPGEKSREGRDLLPEYPYVVRNDDSTETAMRRQDLLHVPGTLSDDGVWGKGVIEHARENIGSAMATEQYGERFFGSDGMPRAVVFLPGLKDPEARRSYRKEWKEVHGGPDGEPLAVLPTEGRLEKLNFSNQDSQFLQSRQFNITDIARWYGVPPHKLFELTKSSFNNIEHQSLEFLTDSLMPWLVLVEQHYGLRLLTEEEQEQGYYFEHRVDALLRGDFESRMRGYQTSIMYGIRSINEVRSLENLNPIGPDGDQHFFPENMSTVEKKVAPDPEPAPPPPPTEEKGKATGQEPEQEPEAIAARAAERARAIEREAARLVLEDALAYALTKEANATRRQAKNPAFEKWLTEFHAEHRATLVKALAPSVAVLKCLGSVETEAGLADRVLADSASELLRAYGEDTPTGFASRLDVWSQRAKGLADAVVGGLPALDAAGSEVVLTVVRDAKGRPEKIIKRRQ